MKQIRAEAFAATYIRNNCCGARALRALGVTGSVQSLSTQAAQLLKKLEVQEALARLRKDMAMDALDVVARMSDMARVSIEDFLGKDNRIDIGQGRRRGKLQLLKRYRERVLRTTTRDDGRIREEMVEREVWLHDAQAALKAMMQYHGLLSDILEIRRLPKDPAELRQFIKERLPMLFEERKPPKLH